MARCTWQPDQPANLSALGHRLLLLNDPDVVMGACLCWHCWHGVRWTETLASIRVDDWRRSAVDHLQHRHTAARIHPWVIGVHDRLCSERNQMEEA